MEDVSKYCDAVHEIEPHSTSFDQILGFYSIKKEMTDKVWTMTKLQSVKYILEQIHGKIGCRYQQTV